jgi:DnaJ-class molecular chaperone
VIEIKKENILCNSRQIGESILVAESLKFDLDNDLIKTCKKCDRSFYLVQGDVWSNVGYCPSCIADEYKKETPPFVEKKEPCKRCKGRGSVLKGTGAMRRTEEMDGPSECERNWETEITVMVACPDCRPAQFAFDKDQIENHFHRYKITEEDYC